MLDRIGCSCSKAGILDRSCFSDRLTTQVKCTWWATPTDRMKYHIAYHIYRSLLRKQPGGLFQKNSLTLLHWDPNWPWCFSHNQLNLRICSQSWLWTVWKKGNQPLGRWHILKLICSSIQEIFTEHLFCSRTSVQNRHKLAQPRAFLGNMTARCTGSRGVGKKAAPSELPFWEGNKRALGLLINQNPAVLALLLPTEHPNAEVG